MHETQYSGIKECCSILFYADSLPLIKDYGYFQYFNFLLHIYNKQYKHVNKELFFNILYHNEFELLKNIKNYNFNNYLYRGTGQNATREVIDEDKSYENKIINNYFKDILKDYISKFYEKPLLKFKNLGITELNSNLNINEFRRIKPYFYVNEEIFHRNVDCSPILYNINIKNIYNFTKQLLYMFEEEKYKNTQQLRDYLNNLQKYFKIDILNECIIFTKNNSNDMFTIIKETFVNHYYYYMSMECINHFNKIVSIILCYFIKDKLDKNNDIKNFMDYFDNNYDFNALEFLKPKEEILDYKRLIYDEFVKQINNK